MSRQQRLEPDYYVEKLSTTPTVVVACAQVDTAGRHSCVCLARCLGEIVGEWRIVHRPCTFISIAAMAFPAPGASGSWLPLAQKAGGPGVGGLHLALPGVAGTVARGESEMPRVLQVSDAAVPCMHPQLALHY